MDSNSPSIKDVFDSLRTDGNSYINLDVLSSKLIEYFSTGDPVEDEYLEDILKNSLNAKDGKIYYEEFYKCFCNIINQQNLNSSRRQSLTSFIEDETSQLDTSEEQSGYNLLNEECFESTERKNSELNNNSLNVSASRQARALLTTDEFVDDMTRVRDSSEYQSMLHQVDELNHKLDLMCSENNFLKDKLKESEEREFREKEENQKLMEKIILIEEQSRENESMFKEELSTFEKETERKLNKLTQQHETEIDEYQAKLETMREKYEHLSSQLIKKDEESEELKKELQATLKQHRLDQDALREKLTKESSKIVEELQQEHEEAMNKIQELEMSLIEYETVSASGDSSKMNSIELSRRDSLISVSRSRSGSRLINMTAELEELVQKLSGENRELKEEINEYKLEVAALRITEGQPRPDIRQRSDTATETFAQELESYGVQQLKEALSKEKETVAQLQDYVNNLLMRIVENYPKLLELM